MYVKVLAFVDTNIRCLKRGHRAKPCLHQPCTGLLTLPPGPSWPCQDPLGQLRNSFLPSVTSTLPRSFPLASFLYVPFAPLTSSFPLHTSLSYSYVFLLVSPHRLRGVPPAMGGRSRSLRGLRTARSHYHVFPLTFFLPIFTTRQNPQEKRGCCPSVVRKKMGERTTHQQFLSRSTAGELCGWRRASSKTSAALPFPFHPRHDTRRQGGCRSLVYTLL